MPSATGDSEMAAKVARDHQISILVHTADPDSALGRESGVHDGNDTRFMWQYAETHLQ